MTIPAWLATTAVVAFALFFFVCGYYVGKRRTTTKALPALLYAARKPVPADLGNTVARQPRQPD